MLKSEHSTNHFQLKFKWTIKQRSWNPRQFEISLFTIKNKSLLVPPCLCYLNQLVRPVVYLFFFSIFKLKTIVMSTARTTTTMLWQEKWKLITGHIHYKHTVKERLALSNALTGGPALSTIENTEEREGVKC